MPNEFSPKEMLTDEIREYCKKKGLNDNQINRVCNSNQSQLIFNKVYNAAQGEVNLKILQALAETSPVLVSKNSKNPENPMQSGAIVDNLGTCTPTS
ncbi:hypothetical protein L3V82_01550 [Thiotrichales bacterium 19S3-7]|nr:hypothetical protein [Thiotrichales bacterium 19S3-7]MCF6800848.1 hypothetical protein [Thiotrichales bacterium 19S3-11]